MNKKSLHNWLANYGITINGQTDYSKLIAEAKANMIAKNCKSQEKDISCSDINLSLSPPRNDPSISENSETHPCDLEKEKETLLASERQPNFISHQECNGRFKKRQKIFP